MPPLFHLPLKLIAGLALAMAALVGPSQAEDTTGASSASSAYSRMVLMKGAWLFDRNCAFCHEKDGRGSVGPNLTDWYFIHGSTKDNLHEVIQNGVPEKGMPTWKSILKPTDLRLIEQYVWSIRGKDLKGKPPEGEHKPDEKAATEVAG